MHTYDSTRVLDVFSKDANKFIITIYYVSADP
jgi:hypothetical protein